MRKFETLLLLSPELSAETREGILTALTGVVERENGVMEEVDHWGMRDLAYPVRKQMRAPRVPGSRRTGGRTGTQRAHHRRHLQVRDRQTG